MTLMLLPDPDKGATAHTEIPAHGVVVPCKVADTELTRKEWEQLIKDEDLPLIVKDVKAADAAEED